MSTHTKQEHWDKVYQTKKLTEVGWYQPVPQTSLDFVQEHAKSKQSRIIDIGGGDSFLTDYLLSEGYQDLTVLDISEKAITRAQKRLGSKAKHVKWVVSDITQYKTKGQFDIWHDRAAFHFLTEDKDVDAYLNILNSALQPGGIFILGTFSDNGPMMCSGLNITQYSEEEITQLLGSAFEKIKCINPDHITPGGSVQNYTFGSFRKV
jgi:2-polyprenyl-3-methyl-5-hydroxy-6-metoxy-1,4-benzoquinol methylase